MRAIYQVDAFTQEPFCGNPAGVCVLDDLDDADWMQHVAAEMNVSETAFLCRDGAGYRIRWFTPTTEVSRCGHATLAAAHLLWEDDPGAAGGAIRFDSASGPLLATRADGTIWLDFPADPPAEVTDVPDALLDALGGKPVWVGRNQLDYVVELADEDAVAGLRPDQAALAALPVRATIVTAAASGDTDFVCRFFAPAVGVAEDPVTGSAQCALGPYWNQRLGAGTLRCRQLSGRGGELLVRTENDRIQFGGTAITVLRGTIG